MVVIVICLSLFSNNGMVEFALMCTICCGGEGKKEVTAAAAILTYTCQGYRTGQGCVHRSGKKDGANL